MAEYKDKKKKQIASDSITNERVLGKGCPFLVPTSVSSDKSPRVLAGRVWVLISQLAQFPLCPLPFWNHKRLRVDEPFF